MMKKATGFLKILILIFFLFGAKAEYAQSDDFKYGKPAEADLNMKVYPADSSAHAVILYDHGESWFEYDVSGDKGWQLYFKRKTRIKILDQLGVSQGDISLSLYCDNSKREKVIDIDGVTINVENGKVVKNKLEKSAIMEEEVDKNHIASKFAMPNVREGSLLDIEYTIKSDFLFNLQPWYFQHTIPVRWSEHILVIPEFFIYRQTMLGYYQLSVNETKSSTSTLTFTNQQRATAYTQASVSYDKLNYTESRQKMVMENVPAFPEETFLSSRENYISKVSFELSSTKSTTNVYTNYTTTWEKINELLLESDDFGPPSKHSGFLGDLLDPIVKSTPDNYSRMVAIFDLIRNHISWNGHSTAFAADTKKAWKNGTGSSAEINLLLNACLKDAGFDAVPVVLSTRSNGILNLTHPSISDLNYVICLVTLGDQKYFLDATERFAPPGLLPERCLNHQGRTVLATGGDWIDLSPQQADSHTAQYKLVLVPDGSVDGIATHIRDGYNALNYRKKVKRANSMEDFYKDLSAKTPGFSISKYEVPRLDSLLLPLREQVEFKLGDAANLSGDMLFFNPMLFEITRDNPFKVKERLYPVEFSFPVKEILVMNWQLPDGYTVDQSPEPVVISLPDDGGKFSYNINQFGNVLTVMSKIQINKLIYLKDEYPYIKEFFNQIIAKQAEQVVIKRIQQ